MDRNNTSIIDFQKPLELLNALELPGLLMQGEPRQVVTANNKACELFGKSLAQIEGKRGGQVFNCIHSYTEAGCGLDENCEDCIIKDAIVDTFSTGNSHQNIQTILNIKMHRETTPHELQVSTTKIGDFAIITIEKFKTIS